MNSPAGRRAVLRSAAAMALLPLFATRQARAADAAAGPAAGPIDPPTCDMIYRRSLQRALPGGAILSTTRDFRVRFGAVEGGFRVDGQQVAARVDAPASLAQLARLEEQRVEQGIFPLVLDTNGFILEGRAAPGGIAIAQAIAEVQRRFEERGAEVQELLDALSASGASITAYLPLDLFAPLASQSEQRQAITLPWGMAGEVCVRFNAARDDASGLMRLATREVVTSLEGSERRSTERWELFTA